MAAFLGFSWQVQLLETTTRDTFMAAASQPQQRAALAVGAGARREMPFMAALKG